jgi:predicted PurR-regulated permease PerM
MSSTVIEVSPKTIATGIGIILLLIVAWVIKPVIFMFFIAFTFSAAFKPYVNYLEKHHIPRIISTIVLFLIFFLVVSIGLVTIVSEALTQLKVLIEQFPNTVFSIVSNAEKVFPVISQYIDPELIKSSLKDAVGGLLNSGTSIVSSGVTGAFEILNSTISIFFTTIMMTIMTVYLLVRKDNVYDGLLLMVRKPERKKYLELLSRIEVKLGEWLRTQLLVMLIIGCIIWFGFSFPGLFIQNYALANYALPIAFLAMLLEVIPGTGAGVAGIIGAIIAFGANQPYLALYIGVFAILLTQVETNYLIPSIMKKVVGVDPILTITGFLAFFILFGPIGAILVIPMIIIIEMVVDFGVDGVLDQK